MANFIRLVHFRFIAILLILILNKNNFVLSQDFSDHPHKGGIVYNLLEIIKSTSTD